MSDPTNFRQERIEKLLHELRYEIERGMMQREIDETLTYRFYVPISQVSRMASCSASFAHARCSAT